MDEAQDGVEQNPADQPSTEPEQSAAPTPEPAPSPAQALVTIKGLSKRYKKLWALKELNLTINRGDLFGFIGPNGAGKTTTMRILATLLRPNTGIVTVAGYDLRTQPDEIRRVIGYMPDFFGVYDDLTVFEYLEFFAACYGIRSGRKRIIENVLEITDLIEKKDELIDALSRGMQQRLGLARVLVHDPPFLILDEPASGLDPRARIEFREILLQLNQMGKTILISSHILSELAMVCNRIAIIEQGQLLFDGNVDEAIEDTSIEHKMSIRVAEDSHRAVHILAEVPGLVDVHLEGEEIEATCPKGQEIPDIAQILVEKGFRVIHLENRRGDLEDVFLNVTEGLVQ